MLEANALEANAPASKALYLTYLSLTRCHLSDTIVTPLPSSFTRTHIYIPPPTLASLVQVVGLRTIVTKLRNDQDSDAATFMEYDHRLQNLRVDVLKVAKEVAGAFTAKDWNKIKSNIEVANQQVKNEVKSDVEDFKSEITAAHGENLHKLTEWFDDHDAMAKSRQATMDKLIQSCARADELETLRENLETDATRMGTRLKVSRANP